MLQRALVLWVLVVEVVRLLGLARRGTGRSVEARASTECALQPCVPVRPCVYVCVCVQLTATVVGEGMADPFFCKFGDLEVVPAYNVTPAVLGCDTPIVPDSIKPRKVWQICTPAQLTKIDTLGAVLAGF